MRMWKVDPKLMCNQHLLGEHVEMHMFVGCMQKGSSLRGYIDKGLVEIDLIQVRHETLAEEMVTRGMNHKSPLPIPPFVAVHGWVDAENSLNELYKRCEDCRNRIITSRLEEG